MQPSGAQPQRTRHTRPDQIGRRISGPPVHANQWVRLLMVAAAQTGGDQCQHDDEYQQ
jgi:hypothetical protein